MYRVLRPALVGAMCAGLAAAGFGRSAQDQYLDEAPLGTWNRTGPPSAVAAAMGGVRYARTADPMAIFANPALASRINGFSITLNGSLSGASLHRFAFVNTGILSTRGNPTAQVWALDFIGISYSWRGWGLAGGLTILEEYARPSMRAENATASYSISFDQDGVLRGWFLSLSKRIGRRLAVGTGFHILNGDRERHSEERYIESGVTLTDDKRFTFSGVVFQAGVLASPRDNLDLGLVYRPPHTRTASGESRIRNQTPAGNTDIQIAVDGESRYKHPSSLGLGLSWRALYPIEVSADLTYIQWSDYSVDYFGESLTRDFRDIVRIDFGLETRLRASLFGRNGWIPLRAGLCLDPQPMRNPESIYRSIGFGAGFRTGGLRVDAAASFGWEKGSGDDLRTWRTVLTLAYRH